MSTDPNASQALQAFSFPTLDGRYLKWFQSHIADFQIIQQAGADAVEAVKRIIADFPVGLAVQEAPSQALILQVQQEATDAGVVELLQVLPQVQELGERLGGLGGILQKLPQIIALIENLMKVWPQIQVLIDTISKLFPATPTTPPATTNPGFPSGL